MKSHLVTLFESKPQGWYPTDKHDANHTVFGKSYLDHYGELFDSVRFGVRSVLEIGVLFGGSLRLWRDYFPNATIVGLDINPDAANHNKNDENVHVVIGDQTDPEAIAKAASLTNGQFDVVIDDGSHLVDHIIATHDIVVDRFMNLGGWYIVEDMRCTYVNVDSKWPGMKYNKELPENSRSKIDTALLRNIECMDRWEGRVARIIANPMMLFFKILPCP